MTIVSIAGLYGVGQTMIAEARLLKFSAGSFNLL